MTDEYSKDEFLSSTDSPAYRGADGTFQPAETAPEFPKSDGLPPDEADKDAKDTPEFIRSAGAAETEGPEGGQIPLDANGETIDTPLYTETALDGQETKIGAVEDEQSNIRQDYVAELEAAKATTNTVAARGKDGEVVDADAAGTGEARAKDSVEQVDPDAAVEAENAKVAEAAKGATETTKDVKATDIEEKAAQAKADEGKNEKTLDALKDEQAAADKADAEKQANIDADAKKLEERGDVATPAAEEGNTNDKDARPEAPAKADAKKVTEQGQKDKGKK